jgi:hypothetical protein
MPQPQQPVRGSPRMAAFVLTYPSLLVGDLGPAARRLRRGSSSGMALRLALCLLWLACAATAQPVQDQARPAATPVPVIVAKASAVTDAARLEVLGRHAELRTLRRQRALCERRGRVRVRLPAEDL